jgi:DNA invertase Pin-like site-specific DNA recombinase
MGKLTAKDKQEIIGFLNDYTPIKDIARMYGISRVTIWKIHKSRESKLKKIIKILLRKKQ